MPTGHTQQGDQHLQHLCASRIIGDHILTQLGEERRNLVHSLKPAKHQVKHWSLQAVGTCNALPKGAHLWPTAGPEPLLKEGIGAVLRCRSSCFSC